MKVHLIQVPYHLGRAREGMGRGPEQILAAGAERLLTGHGHTVEVSAIYREGRFTHEIGASFEVNRLLADRVRRTREQGSLPFVLAGNCNSALGTLSGLAPAEPGVVWFDAHGEFNTPDSTRTGFLDGMPLTMATGRTWKTLCESIPGFRPLPDEQIVLIGARALDPGEREILERSGVSRVSPEEVLSKGVEKALEPRLIALAARTDDVYLHLDLDVLDPQEARVSEYAEPGGLTLQALEQACRLVAGRLRVRAAAIAGYDPDWDEGGKGARAALRLMETVLGAL